MAMFSAATFRILGAAATTQNFFTILNTGTDRVVRVKRMVFQMDATALLTAVMPIVSCSRITAASNGTVLGKVPWDNVATHATVVVRGANASDGGAASAITATPGVAMWRQFGFRMHTVVGQVLGIDNNVLTSITEETPVVLRQNEGLVVSIVAAATGSNPATNHYFVQCAWDEAST